MFFNLILLLFKILFPFIKQKKTLIHVSWVSMVIVILVSNYEFIIYDKVNKNGVQYTYDRFTGNKWKNIR